MTGIAAISLKSWISNFYYLKIRFIDDNFDYWHFTLPSGLLEFEMLKDSIVMTPGSQVGTATGYIFFVVQSKMTFIDHEVRAEMNKK